MGLRNFVVDIFRTCYRLKCYITAYLKFFFEIEKNGRVIKPYNEHSPRNLHRIESFSRFVTNTRRLVSRWRVRFFRIDIFGRNGVSVSGARFKCVFRSTTYGPRSLGAKRDETRRQKCRIAFEKNKRFFFETLKKEKTFLKRVEGNVRRRDRRSSHWFNSVLVTSEMDNRGLQSCDLTGTAADSGTAPAPALQRFGGEYRDCTAGDGNCCCWSCCDDCNGTDRVGGTHRPCCCCCC